MRSSIYLPCISTASIFLACGVLDGVFAQQDLYELGYHTLLARENHLNMKEPGSIDSRVLYPRGPARKSTSRPSTGEGRTAAPPDPSSNIEPKSQARAMSLPPLSRQNPLTGPPRDSAGGLKRTDGWTIFNHEPIERLPGRFDNRLKISAGKVGKVTAQNRVRLPDVGIVPKSPWENAKSDSPRSERSTSPSSIESPFKNASRIHGPSKGDEMDWKVTRPSSDKSGDMMSKSIGSSLGKPDRVPALKSAGTTLAEQMGKMSTNG